MIKSLPLAWCLALTGSFSSTAFAVTCSCATPSDVRIGGHIGLRLDACIEHNVKTTGEKRALDAAIATAKDIKATEINAAGSAATFESWYHRAARETEEGKKPRPIHFCEFASAGNTWKEASLYRVWQHIPLNVTQAPYVPYNPPAECFL
jgi:hypothetical protein